MPNGKPAGVRCVQLDNENRCKIFGLPERPKFCASLQSSVEMCGSDDIENPRAHAIAWLTQLETLTKPSF
jgi:hypothetical protein